MGEDGGGDKDGGVDLGTRRHGDRARFLKNVKIKFRQDQQDFRDLEYKPYPVDYEILSKSFFDFFVERERNFINH